jgi:ribokinase|tara:strand:- start:13951 stop:14826 length:876 start_codon:yes stop_codon:yes gene_type:complete
MIMQLEKIPGPGETLLGNQFSTAAGGKGANQAVAASRAGGEVSFVACIGKDLLGDSAIDGFKKDNIDTTYVNRTSEKPSGVAFIFIDNNGENSIGVASGSNYDLSPAHLDKAMDAILSADVILTQLETPINTVEYLAKIVSTQTSIFILNPAPAQQLSDELLLNIDVITPNETEAQQLTGLKVTDTESAQSSCNKLHDLGVQTVIITMGQKGAYLSCSNAHQLIPSYDVNAVDTTGAGDIFNGVLAVELANKKDFPEAIKYANAAAALSVTVLGAQPSAPTSDAIKELLSK